MSDQKQIWRLVVPLALLVLVLSTTLGVVWHHHVNSSSDTCLLCHLAIAPSLAGIRGCVLVPVGAGPEAQYINLIAYSAPRLIPTRAPPA
jgi:hypothetical protein